MTALTYFLLLVAVTALVIGTLGLARPKTFTVTGTPIQFATNGSTFPLTAQSATYDIPFTTTPLVQPVSVSELTGRGCSDVLTASTTTGFTAYVSSCGQVGNVVDHGTSVNIQPSMAEITLSSGVKVPGIAYEKNGGLWYACAQNTAGTAWYAPFEIASVIATTGTFKLAAIAGLPCIVYTSGTTTAIYAKGADAQWTSTATTTTIGSLTLAASSCLGLLIIDDAPYVYASNATDDIVVRYGDSFVTSATVWDNTGYTVTQSTDLFKVAIINGNPAIAIQSVLTSGSVDKVLYIRSTQTNGSSWPSAQTVLSGATIDTTSAKGLLLVEHSTLPLVGVLGDNGNIILQLGTDVAGSAWGTPFELSSPTGHPITDCTAVGDSGKVAFSYITGQSGFNIPLFQYAVSDTLTTAQLAGSSAQFETYDKRSDSVAIALIDSGMAFAFTGDDDARLYYNRPPAGTFNISTNVVMAYTASGNIYG